MVERRKYIKVKQMGKSTFSAGGFFYLEQKKLCNGQMALKMGGYNVYAIVKKKTAYAC